MNARTAPYGFGFTFRRVALRMPHGPAPLASPLRAAPGTLSNGLERLATWAERQPMHHRMGSYTQLG